MPNWRMVLLKFETGGSIMPKAELLELSYLLFIFFAFDPYEVASLNLALLFLLLRLA